MKKTTKRILKSESILSVLLKEGDAFFIGLTLDEYRNSQKKFAFKLKENILEGEEQLPQGAGPASKTNLQGKLERVVPERKHTITRHIEYTRRTDGAFISYDRDFNVYVKQLIGKYGTDIKCVSNANENLFVVSPKLLFDNSFETNKLNTHVINLFLEIFGIYEIYTEKLEPAIIFHKKFDFEILPSGEFTDEDKNHILEGVRRFAKNEEQYIALKERLDYIQQFKPKILGSGAKGFQGYVVFEFMELNLVILEAMHKDNATYVFDIDNYEENIFKDKQELIKNKLYKKRIKHTEAWQSKIDKILKKDK